MTPALVVSIAALFVSALSLTVGLSALLLNRRDVRRRGRRFDITLVSVTREQIVFRVTNPTADVVNVIGVGIRRRQRWQLLYTNRANRAVRTIRSLRERERLHASAFDSGPALPAQIGPFDRGEWVLCNRWWTHSQALIVIVVENTLGDTMHSTTFSVGDPTGLERLVQQIWKRVTSKSP